jgi:hypothetical protein
MSMEISRAITNTLARTDSSYEKVLKADTPVRLYGSSRKLILPKGTRILNVANVNDPWIVFQLPKGKYLDLGSGVMIENKVAVWEGQNGIWLEQMCIVGRLVYGVTFSGRWYAKGTNVAIGWRPDGNVAKILKETDLKDH